MKSPRVNYLAVGLFVLAMSVAFLGVLAALSGRTGATDSFHSYYQNVTGVLPGTQLLLEGFRVGQVERVEPSPDPAKGRYKVTYAVDRGTRIPEGSDAWITEPSLLAAITIDIHASDAEAILPPGSEIPGRDLASLFTAVATLSDQVETLLEQEIRPLIEVIARSTPEILGNLESVTDDLADATGQVSVLFSEDKTRQVGGMIDDLALTASNLGELTAHLESSLAKVDEMVVSVNSLVVDNADGVERMVADLEHTLASVASRVDAITASLESASHNMDEFSGQVRRNPAVLLRGTAGGSDADGRP